MYLDRELRFGRGIWKSKDRLKYLFKLVAYLYANIPLKKIYIINERGEIRVGQDFLNSTREFITYKALF